MGFKNPAPPFLWLAVVTLSTLSAHSAQDSLTLEQALQEGQNHPSLEASRLEVQARKALAAQAGAYVNPRLSIEAENFAGTGPLSGVQALETTARLEQTVELGGKRSLRRERADAEVQLAEGELASMSREITRTIRDHFGEVLWKQEHSRLAFRQVRVLEEASQLARKRLEAGRGTVAEDLKLRLELARVRLKAAQAESETDAAKIQLSSFLGNSSRDFAGVQGDFRGRGPLPAWDSVKEWVSRHPDLTRWKAEKTLRVLAQKSARAEVLPDLDFNAGVRQIRGQGEDNLAVVGGISIPLPLWNRNRSGIAGATYRVSWVEKEEQAIRQGRVAKARTLWNALRIRASELAQLEAELIPDAEKANEAARSAYAAGRFSSLELLDGQRILFELNDQYIGALAAYHRDAAELEMLAGSAHTFAEMRSK